MKDYLDRIYRAVDYAEDQLKDDIEVRDLAKEAGISIYHFIRLFKTVTGETPSAYVRKRKLSEAKREISDDKEIIRAAFDYGWNSQESFTHAFTGYFGSSPGRVREMGRQPVGICKPLKNEERYVFMDGNKIWRMENLAQQMYSLSRAWAHEAVRLGPPGKGLEIVASETGRLYRELLPLIENLRSGKGEAHISRLEELSEKMKILTLNSTIEAIRAYSDIGRPSLISARELKQLNCDLNNIIYASEDDWVSSDVPEIAEANKITDAEFFFIKFSVKGNRFCENLINIKEIIINRDKPDLSNEKTIRVRGVEIPLLIPSLPAPSDGRFGRYLMILGSTLDSSFAVPVDCININDIFSSPLGIRINGTERNEPLFPLRESWKAGDGSFVDFIDWEKAVL